MLQVGKDTVYCPLVQSYGYGPVNCFSISAATSNESSCQRLIDFFYTAPEVAGPCTSMLHDGPETFCGPEWPTVTANAQGLSVEFSCHFNYAVIHSATHSVSHCVQGL